MIPSHFDSIAPFARPVLRGFRELPVRIRALRQGRGARVVFLPAYGREGSALLRIYNVAAALRQSDWDVHILPPKLTLAQRHRCLRALRPDVVIMQGTRHALNRPALYPDQRIVLDLDDSDFHLPHLAASVTNAMRGVVAVIAGSEYIANWCRKAGAPLVRVVWTGTPVSKYRRRPQSERPPVVAWAQTRPMTYQYEARLVRAVMRQVAAAHPDVTLRLYDRCPEDDPGFEQSFEAPGLNVEWRDRMGYAEFLDSFDDVVVGLAPLTQIDPFCRGKSFGKVLAYLDRGVPVVASDAGEPRAFLTEETGKLCGSQDGWVRAISELLHDVDARERMAIAGFAAFSRDLSVETAADHVARVLQTVLMPGGDEQIAG